MEDLYSIHPAIPRSAEPKVMNFSDLIKAKIASHPRYPSLLSAYIDCQKVGAPPEIVALFEDIMKESCCSLAIDGRRDIGFDPELDQFMESYCQVLMILKEELSKPFDEATSFLTNIEMQLSDLCKTPTSISTITTAACNSTSDYESSEGELGSAGEIEASESQVGSSSRLCDKELKEVLLKKYSGYFSNLRKQFLKKRKKGKLPKDSRLILLDWWNTHYRWPYPTEEEKMKLTEMTGLDQKQINNWFINQRKRHWKPSEDMRLSLMEGITGGGGRNGPSTLYFDTGTFGP